MGQQDSNRHRSTVFHIDGHCRSGKCDLVDNECVTDRSNCFVVARNLCCECIGEVEDTALALRGSADGTDMCRSPVMRDRGERNCMVCVDFTNLCIVWKGCEVDELFLLCIDKIHNAHMGRIVHR